MSQSCVDQINAPKGDTIKALTIDPQNLGWGFDFYTAEGDIIAMIIYNPIVNCDTRLRITVTSTQAGAQMGVVIRRIAVLQINQLEDLINAAITILLLINILGGLTNLG